MPHGRNKMFDFLFFMSSNASQSLKDKAIEEVFGESVKIVKNMIVALIVGTTIILILNAFGLL